MHNGNIAKLKALIVDDEWIASEHLRTTLLECDDLNVDICATAGNTAIALQQIHQYNPDVLLLDIEMPDEDAFRFLKRIYPFDFEVIFVTAFDAYAVNAFRLNAIDYIMKPVSAAEIIRAFTRLREKLAYKTLAKHGRDAYEALVAQVADNAIPCKLFLREQNNITAVAFTDIYFVEAMGSYSKIYYTQDGAAKQIVMSHSIAEYEEILPQNAFLRIHKSYLINCAHLKKISKADSMSVLISDNHTIPVSRRRYPDMMEFIRNHHFDK